MGAGCIGWILALFWPVLACLPSQCNKDYEIVSVSSKHINGHVAGIGPVLAASD